ncbi:hypothetical protein JQX13_31785 [Archangium violaceum]|nr:hypothetical protein JQX13_31785 [Archangium violaceum]
MGVGNTVEEEALFVNLPTRFEPARVGDEEFRGALVALVLEMPLRVATSHPPLYVGRKVALASAPLGGEAWRSELARAYGRFCERRGSPGDCLTLFEDGPQLQDEDKRSLALALAVGPALDARDAELRAMLSSTQLWTTVSVALSGWLALLVMPEPVSKGVAAAFAVLMWGYLGWEFFDLIQAYGQLSEDSARATTFEEIREAGERFGKVLGPNSVRILVLVGTAALGGTVSLMSKGPKLPGFGQTLRRVEANTGVRLMDAATEAERVIVSMSEGSIRVVLPANAIAMTAKGVGSASPERAKGSLLSNGHRAWRSHSGLKKALGPAGKGKAWHHIVEQTPGNVKRFGPEAIHNTENVMALETRVHDELSALYSSIREGVTGSDVLTVRQWLSTQSYEAQYQFGLRAIENIRRGIWKAWK